MKPQDKTLIVIAGPTASGKTATAIALARHYRTEVISADSRQFYREIPVGTAAPDSRQLKEIPHHFIGHLSVKDDYNVSRFESDVLRLLEEKFKALDTLIMAGGSGLYIDAVCNGIDELPDPDPEIRRSLEDLFAAGGLPALQEKLKLLDPDYYAAVDRNNPKRLVRAIEVCLQTGDTYSGQRLNKPKRRDFRIIRIGLEVPRDILAERIGRRTASMLEAGWLEEARSVHHLKGLNALNTVGFKELFAYLDGTWDLETAIMKIKTNTRRYAKRQMTWFRRNKEIKWFRPEDVPEMIDYIDSQRKT